VVRASQGGANLKAACMLVNEMPEPLRGRLA